MIQVFTNLTGVGNIEGNAFQRHDLEQTRPCAEGSVHDLRRQAGTAHPEQHRLAVTVTRHVDCEATQ